jgi:peptidoglycan/xylan/chitin deacetylase (PgdA/CDA1 family)
MRSHLTPRLARVVKHSAVALDRVRGVPNGVVVLIYHRVGGGSGLEVDLDPGAFEDQVSWLAESGRVGTLDEALAALADPTPPPADPIVVTFDDGTADFAEVAVPILERHGVPALMYLATDFIERGVQFGGSGRPLSWAAARDCRSTGLIEFGSHTHTHALLDRLAPAEAELELDRSIGLIADRLGCAARHFAYPKAVAPSSTVDGLVRDRFRSAALAGTRTNRYGATDPFLIARSPVQISDGFGFFVRKACGGMALEDSLRRAANRFRYARATS